MVVLGVRNLKLKSVASSQGAGRLAKLQGQRAGLPLELEKIKLTKNRGKWSSHLAIPIECTNLT